MLVPFLLSTVIATILIPPQLPAYQARVQALMASILEWPGAHGAGAGTAAMRDLLRPSAALSYVGLLGGGLGAALTNILLILLTVIFMLFEASDFPAKLKGAGATARAGDGARATPDAGSLPHGRE